MKDYQGVSSGLACFLDETERVGGKILLVGGYFIPRTSLRKLDGCMERVKKRMKIPLGATIKWNLRDPMCRTAWTILTQGRGVKARTARVEKLRSILFKSLQTLGITAMAATIEREAHDSVLDAWKEGMKYILQRLCIEMKERRALIKGPRNYPFLEVIHDWPSGDQRVEDVFSSYVEAYEEGYGFFPGQLRELSPLRAMGACPCMLVTTVRYSYALQVADMILGAIGDFIKQAVANHISEHATHTTAHFGLIRDLLRKAGDGSVLGYGIIARKDSALRSALERALSQNQ